MGSGPKGERIAQGYKTQGLEGKDNLGLLGSGPKGRRITQGYETQGLEGIIEKTNSKVDME